MRKDTSLMVTVAVMVVTCAWCPSAHAEQEVAALIAPLVGGVDAQPCAAAATASLDGCDATLIHPSLLVTAAHCLEVQPSYAFFGDAATGSSYAVPIAYCGAHPDYMQEHGTDLAFCVLAQQVDVAYVPVIASCEPAEELTIGATLTLIGTGQRSIEEESGARKQWVHVTVDSVSSDERELVTGDALHGACHGDSGGSAYATLPDGSSRMVGVISRRGTTGNNMLASDCAGTTIVTALRPHLAWLEAATGTALTPCHSTAGWDPGPECGVFATGPLSLAWPTSACQAATAPLTPTCLSRRTRPAQATGMNCSSAPGPAEHSGSAAVVALALCASLCIVRARRRFRPP
ncbi:MAG: hypothetical protein RL701_6686, partial [Pseudomonadota bacterium]